MAKRIPATSKGHSRVRNEQAKVIQMAARNQEAINQGPSMRKKFTLHDMHEIEPLTDNQEKAMDLWTDQSDIGLMLEGCAGTGKTWLAIYLSMQAILDQDTPYKKLVIVRSTAQSRDIGFLKGTEEEKIQVFKKPYIGIFDELFKFKKSFENAEEIGLVEFECTSFLRGTTFNDCIVVFDEAQNALFGEAMTVASRMGRNSKLVISGDTKQSDLIKPADRESAEKFFILMRKMKSMHNVKFTVDDIVRSGFVKELIMTQIALGLA